MARYLSNANFGPEVGKLRVRFNNGSRVVYGYVTQQLNPYRFEVSTDDETFYRVELAQTTSDAETLPLGKATLRAKDARGNPCYLRSLQTFLGVTTAGLQVVWNNNSDPEAVKIERKPAMSGTELPDDTVALHRCEPLKFFAYVNLLSPDYVYQLNQEGTEVELGGVVNWGDGGEDVDVTSQDDLFHTYAEPGKYIVSVHMPLALEGTPSKLFEFKDRFIELDTSDTTLFNLV